MRNLWLLSALVLGGAAAAVAVSRGVSVEETKFLAKLTASRPTDAATIQTIHSVLSGRNWAPAWRVAAIVNALAESNLKADAVGDGGESVGLFQLHSRGGGKGMTVEERKDPTRNTVRIAEECEAVLDPTKDTDFATAVRLFCIHVERPANATQRAEERVAILNRYV
jgi:hypothetical protein